MWCGAMQVRVDYNGGGSGSVTRQNGEVCVCHLSLPARFAKSRVLFLRPVSNRMSFCHSAR